MAQEYIIENKAIIDSGLHYTRYTNLPLDNSTLKSIDKDLEGVRHINKINRIEGEFYQQLSTDGSSHQPLNFIIPKINSFNYQPGIYNALIYTRENIKFYNVYKPYSELRYSNTLGSSRYFSVSHAQNVYKNLHVGLEYDVNYTDGKFDKSQVMNQFFNATARYKNLAQTYEGYLGFIRNRALQNESGGLMSDSSFSVQQYSSLDAFPVNISSAYSKFKSADAFLSQKLSIGKLLTKNSIFKNLSLVHDLSYFSNQRIYNDQNPSEGFHQTIFFDSVLSYDSLSTRRLQNIISIRNESIIPFTFGVKHDYIVFADTLNRERSSNLSPFFSLEVDVNKFKLGFDGEYIISSSRYNNDFQIGGNISYNNLFLNIKLINKSVDYFFIKYQSNHFAWDNNFNKIEIFNANLSYLFKDFIRLNLDYFNLNSLVYIGSDLYPKQSNNPTNIIKASIIHRFKLGIFSFNGLASIQKLSSSQSLRLPFFQTKQTAYINFKMFGKKLDTQIGVDLRYNTLFYADRYIPGMGAFAQQNDIRIGNYLFTDLFVQVQLERVKLFLTLSHPYAGLFNYNYYYSPHYPAENLNLRFGISWMFFD